MNRTTIIPTSSCINSSLSDIILLWPPPQFLIKRTFFRMAEYFKFYYVMDSVSIKYCMHISNCIVKPQFETNLRTDYLWRVFVRIAQTFLPRNLCAIHIYQEGNGCGPITSHNDERAFSTEGMFIQEICSADTFPSTLVRAAGDYSQIHKHGHCQIPS